MSASKQSTNYFITGVNRGIGLQLVKLILAEPNSVVVGSVRNPSAPSELNALSAEFANRLEIVQLDQQDEGSVAKLAGQLQNTVAGSEGIDVFIANAAIANAYYPVLKSSRKEWEDHLSVNVIGVIEVLKVIKPFLDKKQTRKLVFTSSLLGSMGSFFNVQSAPYGITKAAINYLNVTLANELKDEHYTALAIHPGLVATDMGSAFVEEKGKQGVDMAAAVDFITPEESARLFLKVVENGGFADSGKFLNNDGSVVAF